jgi:hypothetical protein
MNRDAPATSSVHFDIGRITLHGYSFVQQTRFVSALRTQLTDHATNGERNWLAAQQIAHLDGGTLPAGATPEQAAQRIAARILSTATGGRERHE